MWELDHKESWVLKNWCFCTVVLEKTLESPLDGKEIQPVQPKGNQSWVFIGRTDAEAETPILWPCDAKNWLIGKDPDAGKDWGQEEKGTTEDEMVGWHHWLDGHEFEWTPGVGDGQGVLACCSPWGRKESNTSERLNWTDIQSCCLRPASPKATLPEKPFEGILEAGNLSCLLTFFLWGCLSWLSHEVVLPPWEAIHRSLFSGWDLEAVLLCFRGEPWKPGGLCLYHCELSQCPFDTDGHKD